MTEATTEAITISESNVPSGIGRFPQAGCEHPDAYREYVVQAIAEGKFYPILRGRATDEGAACESYWASAPKARGCPLMSVAEIVED